MSKKMLVIVVLFIQWTWIVFQVQQAKNQQRNEGSSMCTWTRVAPLLATKTFWRDGTHWHAKFRIRKRFQGALISVFQAYIQWMFRVWWFLLSTLSAWSLVPTTIHFCSRLAAGWKCSKLCCFRQGKNWCLTRIYCRGLISFLYLTCNSFLRNRMLTFLVNDLAGQQGSQPHLLSTIRWQRFKRCLFAFRLREYTIIAASQ